MGTALPLVTLAVAGILQGLSASTPWNGQPAGWLQLAAMAIFAWQLQKAPSLKVAAAWGWLFALAWLVSTFWWMFVAMHTYAGLPAWMAALAVVALAAILAIYYAIAASLFVALSPSGAVGAAALFANLWMLAELARGVWFTGFGWGAIGYAHVDHLASFASFVGAYGVAGMVAFIAYLIASILRERDGRRLAGQVALVTMLVVLMTWSPMEATRPAGQIRVALLQGNIAQDEKFQPGSGVPDALQWYQSQLAIPHAPLMVAPETAIPLLPQQLPPDYWQQLLQGIRRTGSAVLIGVPLGSEATGYTNSVVGTDGHLPAQSVTEFLTKAYRYDKHHLVPFGEFVPPFFRWFTELMDIPLGDFRRGHVGQASFAWQGQRLAPNICYEDLFGEELGVRFLHPDASPTIFVNVSNIGWFGNTVAIDQHLAISRMRALEFARPFIRATNTGKTAIIDHKGVVTHALPRHTRGVLVGDVHGRDGATPYAWWVARWGLAPLWLLGSTSTLVAFIFWRRRIARNGPNARQATASETGPRAGAS